MYSKSTRVKLRGAALRALNDAIFKRDNYCCIICGTYVSNDHKFHHEPQGIHKSDEINKGVVLCNDCHHQRHFSAKRNEIQNKIEVYLQIYR